MFPTLLPFACPGQLSLRCCYTFSVVEYVNLGRRLGRGTRIAAKILHGQARGAVVAARAQAPAIAAQGRTLAEQGRSLAEQGRGVAAGQGRSVVRGSREFGKGFWKPFMKAIRALWHEITGVFFALFALFFGEGLWRARYAWERGPEHRQFEVYLAMTLLFAYFSLSSFVRSRRPSREGRLTEK